MYTIYIYTIYIYIYIYKIPSHGLQSYISIIHIYIHNIFPFMYGIPSGKLTLLWKIYGKTHELSMVIFNSYP